VSNRGHEGPRDATTTDRRMATFEQWFGVDRGQHAPLAHQWLLISWGVLPRERMRCMTRFRVSAHDLNVETGQYDSTPYKKRKCNRCCFDLSDDAERKPVQDEKHIMIECSGFADIRARFRDMYEQAHGDMKKLMLGSDIYRAAELVTTCMDRIKPRTVRTVYVPGAANPG
jgi:hypothetical protein